MLRLRDSLFLLLIGFTPTLWAQEAPAYDPSQSIARNWNEALLYAIRNDLARPTVHARNLFHSAAASYDAWAVFEPDANLYFLGRYGSREPTCKLTVNDRKFLRQLTNGQTERLLKARQTAISYAQLRLLGHRFKQSPGANLALQRFGSLFSELSYDSNVTTIEISESTPHAALGNRIAACIIALGANDGANEANNYVNQQYQTVNPPLNPAFPGSDGLVDPNRWQPLKIDNFIDQSGISTEVPIFLGAEWGRVTPFALNDRDLTLYTINGIEFPVYHDPGQPALLPDDGSNTSEYQWGHSLVSVWSSHLDPRDGVMWDISPANIGNTTELPPDESTLSSFYSRIDGGSTDRGYDLNPVTGKPYEPQLVPRGDYTRVLAEFWADGPDSETPPGHWFGILNEAVADHPDFEKRFAGEGPVLDDLQFDVLAYFVLGGAMHDSAIAAWGIKGRYDYIRPLSALRYMGSLGQSTDSTSANYHPQGIPLEPGFIESVTPDDILAGNGGANVGKIKVRAWRGPNFIANPDTDIAGVGWILLENWWPYQRPTFVTPPFAGYVSGHSTFSRAAAEVLTRLTGSAFFPGGLGEFIAKKNEFLVFEEGPSVDVRLQWATFRDASDQTSLSRIWGGIHPPVDDLPGRRIGIIVGNDAFDYAVTFFTGKAPPLPLLDATPPSSNSGGGTVFLLLIPLLCVCGYRYQTRAT